MALAIEISPEQAQKELIAALEMRIGFHNRYISRCKVNKVYPLAEIVAYVKPFANVDELTSIATFDMGRLHASISQGDHEELFRCFSGEYPGKISMRKTQAERVHWSLVDLDSEVRDELTDDQKYQQLIELIDDLHTNQSAYLPETADARLLDLSKKYPLTFSSYRKKNS